MSQLKIKQGNTWVGIPAGGVGVPSGGNEGEILIKSSSVDYATEWSDSDSIFPITTYKATVEISGNWEHMYIVLEKMGKLVVARVKMYLTGNSGVGLQTWTGAIPEGFRPKNEIYPDGSNTSYVCAAIQREDNGTQGQGTIKFWSSGNVTYGINQQGANGTYLSTNLTYFTD